MLHFMMFNAVENMYKVIFYCKIVLYEFFSSCFVPFSSGPSSKSSQILCLLNRQVKVHGSQVCHGNS